MTTSVGTMPDMADERSKKPGRKKATGRKRGRPQGRTPSTTIFARVSPPLGEALDAYVESVRPKTSTTAVVEVALEEYLARHGFWPWPRTPATEGPADAPAAE